MSENRGVLRVIESGRVSFWCPGCDEAHTISVAPGGWTWDGNVDAPTFSPSVKVTGYEISAEGNDMIERGVKLPEGVERYPGRDVCCHSFVNAGQIQFLSDCTHKLVGQTVPLTVWPTSEGDQ